LKEQNTRAEGGFSSVTGMMMQNHMTCITLTNDVICIRTKFIVDDDDTDDDDDNDGGDDNDDNDDDDDDDGDGDEGDNCAYAHKEVRFSMVNVIDFIFEIFSPCLAYYCTILELQHGSTNKMMYSY
jgi:hypothetical protein